MKYNFVLVISLCLLLWVFPKTEIKAQQTLTPPAQTYVLRFAGTEIAIAPQGVNLNLGGSFTIETWIFLEDSIPGHMILGRTQNPRGGDPGTNYGFESGGNGKQIEFIQTTGLTGSRRSVITPTSLTTRKWYHVAATLGNDTIKLYLNGLKVGSQKSAGIPRIDTVHFSVGGGACTYCASGGGGFIGALREVRVWSRALNATELKTNAVKVLSGTEIGLVAYWPLDEGSGQIAHDHSQNSYHLQLGKDPVIDSNDPKWTRLTVLDNGPFFGVKKFPTTASVLNHFALMDFDNDNNLDAIGTQVGSNFTPVSVVALRNDGLGNFSDVTSTVLGSKPVNTIAVTSLIVRDFNNDGRSDLFIGDLGVDTYPAPGAQSQLLIQSADKKLINATDSLLPKNKGFTHFVSAGDIDNDGDIDIYYGNPSAPRLYINDGHGRFKADSTRLPEDIYNPHYPRVGYAAHCFLDADNDGDLDLVLGPTSNQNIAKFILLVNDGKGFYTYGPTSGMPLRYGSPNWYDVSIIPVDINGDGWTDFIATTLSEDFLHPGIQLVISNKDGTFRDATYQLPTQDWPSGSDFRFVTPMDINGDSLIDLVAAGDFVGIQVFINRGNAVFGNATELLPASSYSARTSLPGDLNKDGRIDISFINGSSEFTVMENLRNISINDLILPQIKSFNTNSGSFGDTIKLSGKNFSGTTMVHLEQTLLTFTIKSDSLILAVVPKSAKSGPVTITTPLGAVVSTNTFLVKTAIVKFQSGLIDLGNLKLSLSKDSTFTVNNSGNDTLRFSNITSSHADFVMSPYQSKINPGQTATYTIRFTPKAIGKKTTKLMFYSNAVSSPDSLSVTGYCFGEPVMKLNSSSISYGNVKVGQSRDTTFTVNNSGNDTLRFSNITSSHADFVMSPYQSKINPGQTATYTIRFTPKAIGKKTTKLMLYSNAISSPDSLTVTGYCFGIPNLKLSSSSLSFGNVKVGQTRDTTFTLTNTGSDTLKISSITSANSVFSVTPFTKIAAPAQILNISLHFAPSGVALVSSKLSIYSNASTSPDTVHLSGNGLLTAIEPDGYSQGGYSLYQNFPNPFNGSTTIRFNLPEQSSVHLDIYDSQGKVLKTLVNEVLNPGVHDAFLKINEIAGTYFYQIKARSTSNPSKIFKQMRKMIIY